MEPIEDNTTIEKPHEVTRKFSKKIFFLLLIVIVIISGLFLLKSSKPLPNNKNGPQFNVKKQYEQWVNCNDVRDVIEDNGKIYAACLGGVIIVEKSTGKVIDQLTRSQGLGSNTTTSLVKKGDELYIGTQDGFTRFNLISRKAKKFSVGEGLVNGANITLAEDGDTIWVGTFNGLSNYNTKTEEIINYTTELADRSSGYSISNLLVTPHALFVSVLANSNSPGSIARLDKASMTWERFGPESFGQIGEYARIDFMKSSLFHESIVVSGSINETWTAKDIKNTTWEKLTLDIATKENENLGLISSHADHLYFVSSSSLYSYNNLDKRLIKIFPTSDNQIESFNNNGFSSFFKNNKVWYRNTTNKSWMSWVDVTTQSFGSIDIQDRPINFERVLGAIDGNPILVADDAIWQYNLESDNFSLFTEGFSISPDTPPESMAFYPIPETKFILLFSQLCGQGCLHPQLSILDYETKKAEKISISDEVLKSITTESFGNSSDLYLQLIFDSYDIESQNFNFFTRYDKSQIATYNLSTKKWSLKESFVNPNPINIYFPILCNSLYTFMSRNIFSEIPCNKNLETDQYIWTIYHNDNNTTLTQKNKKTGQEEQIKLKGAEPEYSPFDGFDNISARAVSIVNNSVWIATNRGLMMYDYNTKEVKPYTAKDGLISNEVTTFLVDKNSIWATTNWGGLSRIPY